MKRLIKSAMNRFPASRQLAYKYYRFFNFLGAYRSRKKLKDQAIEDIFTDYYHDNVWINQESVSGDGSTLEYTENLRKELPPLFDKFKVRSILDAPCGDYNWFREVSREHATYVGGDIVADLIQRNRERYEDENTRFTRLDITKDQLPPADLWICRDALFHFSDNDLFSTLRNFGSSEIKYLLATSHTECKANFDILTGQFRLLNLELAPFSLPPPIVAIDDWIEGFPVRKMCLWDRDTISKLLS